MPDDAIRKQVKIHCSRNLDETWLFFSSPPGKRLTAETVSKIYYNAATRRKSGERANSYPATQFITPVI